MKLDHSSNNNIINRKLYIHSSILRKNMPKKNYLTREEQNIWEYISGKEVVNNELISNIFPEMPQNKRNKLLHNLYEKGYLNRARKDLYYNARKLDSFYKLAMEINEGYIGLGSALRHYNLIEYEDFTIFVMTRDFQKNIPLNGTEYGIIFIPVKNLFTGFRKEGDFYISTVEKTIFDCFLKPRFVGFANITKALYDAKLDWNKFLGFFRIAGNNSLCQRAGYILEMMKKAAKLNIPEFVLESLQKNAKTPVKLAATKGKSVFSRRWKVEDNVGEKNILSWWG